ncbi:MAG: GH36-type glycosyl hydrolase domain-containing protein, partial [Candidatus Izemoplasmatales bacterium]
MEYGFFDDKKKEYVITNPKTPVKWINYIGDLSFGGFIDQTGGSLICKGDPAINRISKYIPQMPDSDFKGETAYIRVKTNHKYKTFSPYFTPTLDPYDKFECRVGMGYTKYISYFYGIKTQVTVFVPLNDNRVIRDYKITNLNEHSLDIDFIPLVEYSHFDALKNFNNGDWVPQTMMSESISQRNGRQVLLQYAFMHKNKQMNFFTSNERVSSFETVRENFLGDKGYGTFKSPKSLLEKDFSNDIALRGNNIGALMHHLGYIKPNESKRIICQLGQTDDFKEELRKINKFRIEEEVDQAFLDLNIYWDKLLSQCIINTPDKNMNTMINIFNPRQCNTTLNWSRYLSLYQLGLGARGIGFRDSAQDIMGVLSQSPDQSKSLLIKLLSVQKINGSAMHQFNPKNMVANEGDSREVEGADDYYGDDHLWIILSLIAYLKETGDMSFLDLEIGYYEKDKDGNPIEKSSVLEHLKRALNFTKTHRGKHGLPLLGFADWNDTVNLSPGAESIFNTNLYGLALLEMIDLMEFLGHNECLEEYKNDYEIMKKLFNQHAWDGKWFVRYFDSSGHVYGSHKNDHGKIYSNAQSWSIISGFASKEQSIIALDSLNSMLNTPNGIKLSTPGYNAYNEKIGGITTYPPGAKENGGIFLHANPWVMMAETICGRGNKAYQYYNQINPVRKNNLIDEFECEPYVYPQNILGDEHPQFGLARNSWLSGTASWTYQAATKYILGIMPTFNGLKIDPCIPNDWDSFEIRRVFRASIYNIKVLNPRHIEKGVKEIRLDGKLISGNVLPILSD